MRPVDEMAFKVRMRAGSAMVVLEFPQICDQCFHTFDRHRVVDGGTHAPDGTMALELQHAALLGTFQKHLVERFVLEFERHVHARAITLFNGADEKTALVKIVVKQAGLGDITLLDFGQAALPMARTEAAIDIAFISWERTRIASGESTWGPIE